MPDIYSKVVTRWFFGGKGYANRRAACKAKAIKIIKAGLRELTRERHGTRCNCCGGTGSDDVARGIGECFICKGKGLDFSQDDLYKVWEEEFPHEDEFKCRQMYGGKCVTTYEYAGSSTSPNEAPSEFRYSWCKTAYMKRVKDLTDVLMTEKAVSE